MTVARSELVRSIGSSSYVDLSALSRLPQLVATVASEAEELERRNAVLEAAGSRGSA